MALARWTFRVACVSGRFLPGSAVYSLLMGDGDIGAGRCGSRLRCVCGRGKRREERPGWLGAQIGQDGVNRRPVLLRHGSLFLVVGRDDILSHTQSGTFFGRHDSFTRGNGLFLLSKCDFPRFERLLVFQQGLCPGDSQQSELGNVFALAPELPPGVSEPLTRDSQLVLLLVEVIHLLPEQMKPLGKHGRSSGEFGRPAPYDGGCLTCGHEKAPFRK
jgi:hypothetical protein